MSETPLVKPTSSIVENDDWQSQGFRVIQPATSVNPPDAVVGWSVLLAASAIGFALWGLWVVNSTYDRYRGRTDLDMPDWFAINMDLTLKMIPLVFLGIVCLLVSGGLFLGWASRASGVMRAGFIMQWLVSAAILGLVVVSRLP